MVRMNYFYKKNYTTAALSLQHFSQNQIIFFFFFDILHKCHLSYICLTCKGSYHLKVMPAFNACFHLIFPLQILYLVV